MQTHKQKQEVTPTQRMLNTWAIVLIIWALYRYNFKTDLPLWVDEFIAKPFIFLTPLYYYITRTEKKPFLKSLGISFEHWKFDISMFFYVGLVFLGVGAYSSYAKFQMLFPPNAAFYGHYPLILLIVIAITSGICEELLSRGFVLKRMLEEKLNPIYAVFYNSFLYFFLHIPILFTSSQITGYLILQVLAMDVIFSLTVSSLFLYKRSTLLAILIHIIYNVSLYLFLS